MARAHHGSLAREQRLVVEEDLKAGRIPCLVATSSLELGIDMGAVDLVIQVESPKSVARGLQRIGRSGHTLEATAKGRVFPKFRSDLLESAVVARAMVEGEIEETKIPRNPLDVLAQQIVGIVADGETTVDDLHELVRGAYPFADLSRLQLENVLDMLAGRYPSDEFAELRPRIVWDRTANVIRGREGARRLAVQNAGTIPDRGLFGVYLVGDSSDSRGGGRVGELDEEMVYEARAGQTFLLGASTWRIEEITRDRVLVSPAPGVPGAVPFWKGEGVGRPYELGEKIGRASRELAALPEAKAVARLTGQHFLDERAARNLLTFLREQEAATRAVPSDRTIVVERFRDEIGDWRVCILTPFGGRVHSPWAMALQARLRDVLGLEAQAIWSDDGIALHLPDADATPALDDLLIDPDEIEDIVVAEVGQTALFGARFRENAGRALLIPRRRPGQRTPLWQQRLKAQSLLEVARRYGSFPVVLETYRECLQDVFDLPALKQLLQGLKTRQIDLVDVETPSASPYSASLLFDYIATYMYEDDTPPAERRAQALSLDRDLLQELLGQEELRDLLDADAVDEVERSLRGEPRSPDQLHDVLRLRGELREGEYDPELARPLLDERRALNVRIAGEERLIAAEDAGRYRDALGVMPPGGLPEVYLEGGPDSLRQLVLRYAKGRGPFTTERASERFGLDLGPLLHELERQELLVRGELRPGGAEREWCDPDVLRRLRRASLAALRREVEPVEQAALARFLPSWHGVGRRSTLREALVPLQGLALPVALWESELLPRRVHGYRPEQLDQLCATGEVVWVGAGLDRVAVFFREDAPALGRPSGAPAPASEEAERIREALGREAMFWFDLLAETDLEAEAGAPGALGAGLGGRGHERRLAAAPRRAPLRNPEAGAAAAPLLTLARGGDHGDAGSLVAHRAPLRRRPRPARARRAAARAAGDRDPRRRPQQRGSRAATAPSTANCGRSRRSGSAGGVTSSRVSAAPSSRSAARSSGCASCGRARTRSPTRSCSRRPTPRSRTGPRSPGRSGRTAVRRGSRARTSSCSAASRRSTSSAAAARCCRCATPTTSGCGPRSPRSSRRSTRGLERRWAVERFDGEPIAESDVLPLLLEAGFLAGPRRVVLRR